MDDGLINVSDFSPNAIAYAFTIGAQEAQKAGIPFLLVLNLGRGNTEDANDMIDSFVDLAKHIGVDPNILHIKIFRRI